MFQNIISVCLAGLLFLLFVITTIVFCFWFVYLFDAIQRKLVFYRYTVRRTREREVSSEHIILVYDSKTEFVKYIFLFFLNLVEWMELGFGCCSYFVSFIREYASAENNKLPNATQYSFYITYVDTSKVNENLRLVNCFPFLANFCLIGVSACIYLQGMQRRVGSTQTEYPF